MINLGKLILLLLLIPYALYGGVTASVSSSTVTLGEEVTLNLKVSGENIQRPTIYTICDSDVTSTGSQTSIQIVNGDYQKSYILNYQFVPQKSCEIKPIEIEIDGVTEVTKPIKIKVKAMDVAKDSEFVLILQSSKKEVFVGEQFEIVLLFKQRAGANAVDSKFVSPDLKGLWVKEEKDSERYEQGEYTITKLSYIVSAQRAGKQKITPAQMKIASRDAGKDSWGAWIPQIKWRTYFSNELSLDVKPLPAGVDLVGDFTISAVVDKNTINVNEAVNITVTVKGIGNLEDIKTFKPYIDGVNSFDEKIRIRGAKLSQKIALVSDKDFIIPPFTLKFFNPKTSKIQTIQTKAIPIKVHGAKLNQELKIKRETENRPVVSTSNTESGVDMVWIVLAFIGGIALGVLVMLLKPWKLLIKEKQTSIKDPKVLLIKLFPYKDDEEVQKIVDILEKNIYSNENIEIDKKVLKTVLTKYNIK